jgi:hypothetical protein
MSPQSFADDLFMLLDMEMHKEDSDFSTGPGARSEPILAAAQPPSNAPG